MILFVHMIFGATIGHLTHNLYLAIILAFFSHYFLDFIPHADYNLKNKDKGFKLLISNASKIGLDIILGIVLILIFSNNQPVIYICGLTAIFPDFLTFLNGVVKNKFLNKITIIHTEKIHFLKYKKIPIVWRFLSQFLIVALSIFLIQS